MKIFVALLMTLGSLKAFAGMVDWAGTYRIEYVEVDRATLATPGGKKGYILNHLNLSPKLIATDGVNIVANFEVLPNIAYPDSQLGQSFGGGTATATSTTSSVVNGNQKPSSLQVNQLYLQVNQEYGTLIAGRAPLHFGLGITQNSATGAFDHWYRVRDLVGYKVVIGNLSIMPALGKISDVSLGVGGDVTAQTWNLDYNNPETESSIGIFYETRQAGQSVNDANRYFGGTVTGAWGTTHTNVYFARGFEAFKFRMEAGFQQGETGLTSGTGETVKLSGYGVALEMDFPRPQSKWNFSVRTGIASGDNSTTSNYEGFVFDRNYDVAFLLFNHPMGNNSLDIFSTRIQRNLDVNTTCSVFPCTVYDKGVSADEETISNAIYFAPRFGYSFSDKWDWNNSITYAMLQTSPAGMDKAVGYEWDTGIVYKPHSRIRWENTLGLFFPGAAFQGTAAQSFNYGFTFGFQSRAAISF